MQTGEIYPASEAVTSRTQVWGEPFQTPTRETFPPVGYAVYRDAVVMTTRQFPYLLAGSEVMVGSRRAPGPWKMPRRHNRVRHQDGYSVLLDTGEGPHLDVDHALLLGGHDFTNWYHWLVDCLPQLFLAERLPEPYRRWPVLIPEQIRRYPTMVHALELFLESREIIWLPEWALVHAREVVWLDSLEISNIPESLTDTTDEARIHMLHREGMEAYRDRYLAEFCPNDPPHERKVFLIRSGTRRIYNQDQVIEVARRHGFEPIAPDTLTLAEQVRLFRESRHIIGPSGAGFAGVLFCQPETNVLCWQDSRIRDMTILPDLATLNHSTFDHIFYEAEDGGVFTSSYTLDTVWLEGILQRFVEDSR